MFSWMLKLMPSWARRTLRRVKYAGMGKLSLATYWNLAAFVSPTAAICTDCVDEERFFGLGRNEARLMHVLGLLGPEVRALDIGCGIGRVEKAISPEIHSIVGVDVSSRMVKLARQKVRATNVGFETVDGWSLGIIPSNQFNLCFSFFVFQHMPRAAVRRYFADVARALNVDGRFLFQLPVAADGANREPPPGHPFGMRYYSVETVAEMLHEAGMTLVDRFDLEGRSLNAGGVAAPADQYFLAVRNRPEPGTGNGTA